MTNDSISKAGTSHQCIIYTFYFKVGNTLELLTQEVTVHMIILSQSEHIQKISTCPMKFRNNTNLEMVLHKTLWFYYYKWARHNNMNRHQFMLTCLEMGKTWLGYVIVILSSRNFKEYSFQTADHKASFSIPHAPLIALEYKHYQNHYATEQRQTVIYKRL